MSIPRPTPRLPARGCWRGALVALLIAAAGGCQGGCRSKQERAAGTALAAFPAETRIVLALDVARVRESAVWRRVTTLVAENPEDRRKVAAFTAETGLDPLRQISRVLAAFPDDARKNGEFALLLEADVMDERRLVAWAEREAAKNRTRIEQRTHAGRTLWASTGPQRLAALFVGKNRVLIGGGGWGERLAELAAGSPGMASADDNGELLRLATRVGATGGLWFAAIVPTDVRRMLLAEPRPDSAASVTRLGGSVDLSAGLTGRFVADMSNAADASALAQRIEATLREAKGDAQTLMLGLGPYLEAVKARADGPAVRVDVALTPGQVDDLVGRLAGLLKMARGLPPAP